MKRVNVLIIILFSALSTHCQSETRSANETVILRMKNSDMYKSFAERFVAIDAKIDRNDYSMNKGLQRSMSVGKPGATAAFLLDTLTGISLRRTDNYNKSELYSGLEKWLAFPPDFAWTSTAIEQPRALGIILLTIRTTMKKDEMTREWKDILRNIRAGVSKFIRYSWNNGTSNSRFESMGGNLLSETQRMGNVGYRMFGLLSCALVIEDYGAVDTLSMIIRNQFKPAVNRKGYYPVVLKSDGIIDQHNLGGSQVYNIGYGGDWINDMIRCATWLKDTKWELKDADYAVIGRVLLDGNQWMFFRNRSPFNLMGRHNAQKIGRNYSPPYMDQTGNINQLLSLIKDKNSRLYSSLTQYRQRLRNLTEYNIDSSKYFWNSDLLIQSSSSYYAAVKMSSVNNGGVETGDSNNGEGISNFHMGDGSAILFRTGREYDRARSVWNWRRIPGITAKQNKGQLPLIAYGQFSESNNIFSGGVSDGRISISAFYQDKLTRYNQVKVVKSYFAFEKMLVFTGNMIDDRENGGGNADVNTTISQCERQSRIVYNFNGRGPSTVSENREVNVKEYVTSPSWFWQDNIGYVILPSEGGRCKVELSGEKRAGSWKKIDKRNPDEKVTVDIFQLLINHGNRQNWLSRDYRYIILPGVTEKELATFVERNFYGRNPELAIKVDKHTHSIFYKQYLCILAKSATDLQWSSGGRNMGIKIKVPCAVILKWNDNKLEAFANRMDSDVGKKHDSFMIVSDLAMNLLLGEMSFTASSDRLPVHRVF